ncbi:MAG: aldehyde dehydrogenase [Lachnotalea sp.]
MNNTELSQEEAFDVFNTCQRFFHTHKTYSISFRMSQLVILKNAIRRYERSIIKALQKDLGKSNFESYSTEVGFVKKNLSDAIKYLPAWSKDVSVKTPFYLLPAESKKVYEPYGTVLIMAPFNYPFQLLIEPLIGAICAGNCVVLKPSELAPWTSMIITKMISEVFNPKYIRCIEGGIGTNQALLNVPFKYIFFTGSINVGKIVMEAAAKNLTPVTLELGGKSPALVDETANIKWAANRIVWGKFMNAGQTCIAPDYVLAHSSVKQELMEELEKSIVNFFGADEESSDSYGRIINTSHFNRLSNLLDADADYIIYGGSRDVRKKYIQPTLLDIPNLNVATMKEELFGPILPILTYESLEEAKSIIETIPTPLALYLFTTNKLVKDNIVKHTSSGGVCINDTIEHIVNPHLPFGGVGTSGMGSYHGKKSFITFSHQKSVFTRVGTFDMKFMAPPYTNSGLRILKTIFK